MGRLHYKNLVPELTAALAVEMHAGTRKTMEFYLRLLRDGYILKKDADGRYSVTVPMPNGGISGRFIDEKLLREKGIDAIVAEYVESATKSPLWR